MKGSVSIILFLAVFCILLVFHREKQRVTIGEPFPTEREKRPKDMGTDFCVSSYVFTKTVKQDIIPAFPEILYNNILIVYTRYFVYPKFCILHFLYLCSNLVLRVVHVNPYHFGVSLGGRYRQRP